MFFTWQWDFAYPSKNWSPEAHIFNISAETHRLLVILRIGGGEYRFGNRWHLKIQIAIGPSRGDAAICCHVRDGGYDRALYKVEELRKYECVLLVRVLKNLKRNLDKVAVVYVCHVWVGLFYLAGISDCRTIYDCVPL